jgi:serine/threonine protein kinase
LFGDSIKIGDFGYSRELGSKYYIETRNISGTLSYIAPEIWRGKPYNARSDLFAFGCIVYELCTL